MNATEKARIMSHKIGIPYQELTSQSSVRHLADVRKLIALILRDDHDHEWVDISKAINRERTSCLIARREALRLMSVATFRGRCLKSNYEVMIQALRSGNSGNLLHDYQIHLNAVKREQAESFLLRI